MKKGFTLIELLAVIVILAIIALIATPIVLSIIDDTSESALLRSADFYLDAVELSVANYMLDGNDVTSGSYSIMSDGNLCMGTFADATCSGTVLNIEVNGQKPTSGVITFEGGKVATYKNLNINDEYVSAGENGASITDSAIATTLCIPVTDETKTTGNVPSGNYANGDEYICEVKNGTFYHFFVIGKEDSGEINLIADRNMKVGGVPATSKTDSPAWVSYSDYSTNPNIVNTICNATGEATCYNRGPITVLNQLDLVVGSWTNLPLKEYKTNVELVWGSNSKDYTLTFEPDDVNYPGYTLTRNTRGRLITALEAYNNGCKFEYDEVVDGGKIRYNTGSCPLYMINYAHYKYPDEVADSKYNGKTKIDGIRGYWTSTVQSVSSTGGNCVVGIYDTAAINCENANVSEYFGIRPVITLPTTDLG